LTVLFTAAGTAVLTTAFARGAAAFFEPDVVFGLLATGLLLKVLVAGAFFGAVLTAGAGVVLGSGVVLMVHVLWVNGGQSRRLQDREISDGVCERLEDT
jgi:hypothetical protein